MKEKVKVKSLSHVRLFATPRTVAYQASLTMGLSRQEYWEGVAISFSNISQNQVQIRVVFYSVTDISDRTTLNINLATRVLHLLTRQNNI